jgi:hypothetical protein
MLDLSADQRETLLAVVLDTSSMGGGNLSLSALKEWAGRCAANDLELWIPEVVLWEWAEHAASAFERAAAAAGKDRAELRKVGIDAEWSVDDAASVIDHVVEQVRATPGVVVLGLDPQDALDALQDQVLQRPPGSKKQGTKTGAADSALLRATYRKTGGALHRVVLVTGDRNAVDGMCARMGWPRPHTVDALHVLAAALGLLDPATVDQAWELALAIARELPAGWPNPTGALDVDAFRAEGVERAASADVRGDLADFLQDAGLSTVDRLVGVTDVLADTAGGRYLAEAYFLCTAVAHTAGFDNDGATVHEEHEAPNLLLRCRVRAAVADGRLAEFDPGGVSVDVFGRDDSASTLRSGLAYAREALAAVPGLTDGRFPPDSGGVHRADVRGHHVELTAAVDADGDEWAVTADVDGQTVAVPAVPRFRPSAVERRAVRAQGRARGVRRPEPALAVRLGAH